MLVRRSGARRSRRVGQALILALGGALVVIAGALALVAIAGAVTGKGRVQRAADLAAISAARSLRDDLPRLLAPPTLADGRPNPAHIEKPAYLARAARPRSPRRGPTASIPTGSARLPRPGPSRRCR